MSTATLEATLESVGSHTVSTRGNWSHRGHESEKCFPVLKVTVGGVEREVRMEANRYHWSDWRIFLRDISPTQGIGEVTRRRLADVCTPMVEAWIDSDAYRTSRSRAFVWFIRGQIREEHYDADRPAGVLEANRDELTENQYELLRAAVEALGAYLDALEAVNRETI